MIHWFYQWKEAKDSFQKKSILVFNQKSFKDMVDMCKINHIEDVAYISISASEECASDYFHDLSETEHYLENSDNVLNLNFDDITEDFTFKNQYGNDVTYHAMSLEQARQIIEFVEKNKDKNIIVHCRAGKSRSAAVARALFDCYIDIYAENNFNNYNQINTPNPDVLAKVKRAFYEKHCFFQEN